MFCLMCFPPRKVAATQVTKMPPKRFLKSPPTKTKTPPIRFQTPLFLSRLLCEYSFLRVRENTRRVFLCRDFWECVELQFVGIHSAFFCIRKVAKKVAYFFKKYLRNCPLKNEDLLHVDKKPRLNMGDEKNRRVSIKRSRQKAPGLEESNSRGPAPNRALKIHRFVLINFIFIP